MKQRPELGDLVKDHVTGLKGIVVGETKWLFGCRRLVIQPQQLEKGVPVEGQSFDEMQVTVIKKGVVKTADTPIETLADNALAVAETPVRKKGGPDPYKVTRR